MKEPAANIEPAFISKGAASYIASTYNAGHAAGPVPTLTLDDVCLETCNSFLDYLLAMIIRDARSTNLQTLKGSLARVLDSALGYVALNEAQAELETYRNQENGQGRQFPTEEAQETSNPAYFDVEGVWSQARIRCMIYSTIGEKEESDFPVIEDDESSVTPPVAIFLTAVLEFLGEHILVTAARFARNRMGPNTKGELTSTDLDRGIRLDKVLGTIWQGYLQLLPNPELLNTPTIQENRQSQREIDTSVLSPRQTETATLPSLAAIPEQSAQSQKGTTAVAPPLAHDSAPRKSDASVYTNSSQQTAKRDDSPGLWSSRAKSVSGAAGSSPPSQLQKATMWAKQEHVAAAQLRGIDEVKQTSPMTSSQTSQAYASAQGVRGSPSAQLSPQIGSGTVTPRKSVQTGYQSPKIGVAEPYGKHEQPRPPQGLGLSMPSITEPDSDYGRFMQSEKLRLGANRDAQEIEAQRMRVIAKREATIAEQQATKPRTPKALQPHSPPSDLFVETTPKASKLEPREPRVSSSHTARLATFLRDTGPDDAKGAARAAIAVEEESKAEHLTRSPIRQPLEEDTEEDDEDAHLFDGVMSSKGKNSRQNIQRRESLAEFLKNVPPPINNGASLPEPIATGGKGPIMLGKALVLEEDELVAGPAYEQLPAGTRKVEIGTTASEANAAELARKEQNALRGVQSPERRTSGMGLAKILSPMSPDRSASRVAVTSPRSPTSSRGPANGQVPVTPTRKPAASIQSGLSDRGDDETRTETEEEFYDDDSLYGLPRRKQPQLESLADFLRNVPPPTSTSATEKSPDGKRRTSVAKRISSLLGSSKKQDPTSPREERFGTPGDSPTTPSRPNHRPLITSSKPPQL